MSTIFTAYCQACDEDGPQVRRGAGGVGLQGATVDDPASDAWELFLDKHEWHGPVKLYTEHTLRANYGVIEVERAAIDAAKAWKTARDGLVTAMKTKDDDPNGYMIAMDALGYAVRDLISALRRV